MCLLLIWRLILFMFREPCSHLDSSPAGRGLKGCTRVYHWHQSKHDSNASSLAHLPNSAFSLTDFEPLCKMFSCLKRTFLPGLQFCRSQYFNTLLLENFPFLILPFNGFPFEVGEHGAGLRLHIRAASLLRSEPTCECACVSELVNCFTGCVECGVMLARVLDSVSEHFRLRKGLLQLQIQHISEESFGNYVLMSSWKGWKWETPVWWCLPASPMYPTLTSLLQLSWTFHCFVHIF